MMMNKGVQLDKSSPTLLCGCGGFEKALGPHCVAPTGIAAWLERGGVCAEANMVGGGKFGPTWHEVLRFVSHHFEFHNHCFEQLSTKLQQERSGTRRVEKSLLWQKIHDFFKQRVFCREEGEISEQILPGFRTNCASQQRLFGSCHMAPHHIATEDQNIFSNDRFPTKPCRLHNFLGL